MGVLNSQLSVKILVISQLTVKILANYQLSVKPHQNPPLSILSGFPNSSPVPIYAPGWSNVRSKVSCPRTQHSTMTAGALTYKALTIRPLGLPRKIILYRNLLYFQGPRFLLNSSVDKRNTSGFEPATVPLCRLVPY